MLCRKDFSREKETFTLVRLNHLKVQLLKRLYIQKHYSSDNISAYMDQVSDETAIEAVYLTVPWKFSELAKGESLAWTLSTYVRTDVLKVTCSYHFANNFTTILDANDDEDVDETEFLDFFNLARSELELIPVQCIYIYIPGWLCLLYHYFMICTYITYFHR